MSRAVAWSAAAVALCVASAGVAASGNLDGTVTAGGRPQKNAAVWLDAPRAPKGAAAKAILNQTHLSFQPEVLVVRAGTVVTFPNNDTVLHNVFSFRDGKKFDLGIYPVGASKEVTFDTPGLSRIFCNIHPNMAAYVLAVDSPYFAVSDADGRFALPDVPEGVYTWHAWRSNGPDLTGTIRAAAGAVFEIRWP